MASGLANSANKEPQPSRIAALLLKNGAADLLPSYISFTPSTNAFSLAAARRMAELAQGLGFDLANALARHLEALPNLFQRVLEPSPGRNAS